jgi:hypothetical protein
VMNSLKVDPSWEDAENAFEICVPMAPDRPPAESSDGAALSANPSMPAD